MKHGCVVMVIYLAVWFVASLIAEAIFGQFGGIIVRILVIFAGFKVIPQILRDIRQERRREAPSAAEIMAKDNRPPILYLRSFREDGSRQEISPLALVMPLTSPIGAVNDQTPTYEEALAKQLESIGPFVALSNREYALPELGAARLQTQEETWRVVLEELLPRCRLVIFRAGDTESLLWELERLVELVPAEKVIVYLQIGVERDAAVQQARYNKFRRLAEPILPRPLPEIRGKKSNFLHFSSSWVPIFSRSLRKVLTEKGINFEPSSPRYKLKRTLPLACVDTGVYEYDWPFYRVLSRLGIRRGASPGRISNQSKKKVSSTPPDDMSKQKHHSPCTDYYSVLGWIVLALTGAFTASLCGVAYGLLTANTPAPLFNTVFLLILSCIAGVLIGFTGRYLALHGGVKYLLLGLIAGLSFCYARWVTWSVVVFYEATLDPGQILWLLSVVMDYVVHQPEFYSVDEALVWGIWLTEALSATCVISLAAWVYGLSEYEYRRAVGNCQCSSDMVPSVFGQGGPLTGMTVGKLQTIETVDATGQ